LDLNDTRQIPMWMANPALPVVAGVLLFVALGVITASGRAQPLPEPEDTTIPTDGLLGPDRVSGTPTVAPPTPANTPGLLAAKKVREHSQRGEFLKALLVLRAMSADDRKVIGSAEFRGQERRLLQGAGERLLLRVKSLKPGVGIEKLQTFLDVPGVDGHEIQQKVLAALSDLSERSN
jgi:hypothetical protein